MFDIGKDFIMAVAPRFSGDRAAAQKRIVEAIAPVFAATLDRYQIDTLLRIAHFMGQVTHECAGFRTTEEFADGSAYEGRRDLGNLHRGDGPRYKGRGLLQLTGRANYRRLGAVLGLPLEDDPELAGDPVISLRIACEYWKDRRINDPADRDDLVTVTRRVNGGTNGLADRGEYLKKAKVALLGLATGTAAVRPILHRGMSGDAVGTLQTQLRRKGFQIAIDNDFGPATELAVKMFQTGAGLVSDGIVGPATWAAVTG